MALPVVTTNYSGTAAVASPDAAWLLPPYDLRGGYAQPKAADLAAALRDIFDRRDAASAAGRRGRDRVTTLFSPAAVAARILAAAATS